MTSTIPAPLRPPALVPAPAPGPVSAPGSARSAAGRIRSLPGILHAEAARMPDRVVLTALDRDGEAEATLTAANLDRSARAVAAALLAVAAPGDRVLVPAMPGLRFHVAFLSCLYAGLVAVPVPPIRATGLRRTEPTRTGRLNRLLAICADARPAAAVVPENQLAGLTAVMGAEDALRDMRLIPVEDGPARSSSPAPVAKYVEPDELAFLQYTSGSTSAPRGVMITHGAMLANQRAIRDHLAITPASTMVSWLPTYHDMGLCAGLLQPLYARAAAVVFAPETFMVRPERWLQAISGRADAVSAAPDFAYSLCAARVGERLRAGLDLSGWRVAISGAEPVQAETVRAFLAAFAGCGFREAAFTPAYGLAESTLFVTGTAGSRPVISRYDRKALGRGRALVAVDGQELVGCGSPGPGIQVRIVDPDSVDPNPVDPNPVDPDWGRPCPPGTVGEIWVASASNGAGYWGQDEDETFGARLAADPGRRWLRTGDLGFLDGAGSDAELFVTGRRKDLIILRGVNYYPQDLERLVRSADPLLGQGLAAAFAVDPEDHVVVAVEVPDEVAGADADRLAAAAVRAVAEELPVLIRVLLVPCGRVPRTTSGKVRRQECARRLAGGDIPVRGRWPRHAG